MKKIIISGEIGWDIYPDDIRSQLAGAKGDDLEVHIASPGGSVIQGIEIFNMFRDYKRDYPDSESLAIIKGMAASMASYLAVNPVFDLVAAEDNAVFMIHNAWGATYGDYREMKTFSEVLEGLTNIIGKAYTKKTGKSISEIREMMDGESWFFGDEILEAGFVDEMMPSEDEDKNKAVAIAKAKSAFSAVSKKINETDQKQDMEKIAAIIKPNETDPAKTAQTPAANAGNNITEVVTMTLTEFMAENPAAKIELESQLKEKFEAGEKAGRDSLQDAISTAAKYLGTDSVYPAEIKAVAIGVLDGKISVESLNVAVTIHDSKTEAEKSETAKKEAEGIGDTASEQPPDITQDGVIKNEADFDAEIRRTKTANGMEV